MFVFFKRYLIAISAILMMVGCASPSKTNQEDVVKSDLEQVYFNETLTEITVEDAIALGLAYNLDSYIAEQDKLVSLSDKQLQKFNALPTVTAKADFITRSNAGASSSRSALTGVESLEPSISTDRSRWVSALEANWNVLDSAISIYRSKSAEDRIAIAEERARKVRQNIIMDVYSAFWRAVTAQETASSVEEAINATEKMLDALKVVKENGDMPLEQIAIIQEEIIGNKRRLKNLHDSFALADLELKALISYPPEQELKLVIADDWFAKDNLPIFKSDTEKNIKQALKNRPEIKEEILNLKVSERDLNATIYETFPGLNLLVTANSDNNSFLQDNEWAGLVGSISQSLTRLLTLPARYDRAKKEIDLIDARRRALIVAIISQSHIAERLVAKDYKDYEEQIDLYDTYKEKYARSKHLKDNGLKNGFDEVIDRLGFEITQIEMFESFARAQGSFARLMNSIGYDIEEISNVAFVKESV